MPSSTYSGPVTTKPRSSYQGTRWDWASTTQGPEPPASTASTSRRGRPRLRAAGRGTARPHRPHTPPAAHRPLRLEQRPQVGHRLALGVVDPPVAGAGLQVPPVELGIGAGLLH